jgi:hypothetical protein
MQASQLRHHKGNPNMLSSTCIRDSSTAGVIVALMYGEIDSCDRRNSQLQFPNSKWVKIRGIYLKNGIWDSFERYIDRYTGAKFAPRFWARKLSAILTSPQICSKLLPL